ncbi:DUF7619 domain-containing protein [Flavobacterium terrigena]|uniref:Delta-60 repeat domain-containing protein/Por secretion system C-terminal sorting domain-containing protein n=1 Tax=Flavobacterium terrigena TaxID=402734 RepID=A0A1H6S1E5_9FLAO|nr:T9SS type A sorting domain-containing protein [Flavobacterium terrigena]SEI57575.1 delta-60 repeat domain-containing protein/Por secretion system C-terminal sorting domain-containing protein [Flavobacterium terrigena]
MKYHLLLFTFFFSFLLNAQNGATIENTFNINNISNVSGGSFSVTKCFSQLDGKIILNFDYPSDWLNDVLVRRVERLNIDGTLDTTYNIGGSGFNNKISDIHFFSDGKALVSGSFTQYNGVSVTGLVMLNSDASIDTSFSTNLNGSVSEILVQTDGKILIGGVFTVNDGVTFNRILRLNTDGSVDSSFNIGTGFNGIVASILQLPNNKIIIGGSFTSYNAITANRIVSLNSDGTIDSSFVSGSGFDTNVNTLCVSSDNKLYVGGYFTSYNGVANNRIVKINLDGSIDNSFVSGSGFDSEVSKILLLPDGNIAVLGFFYEYNGSTFLFNIKLDNLGQVQSNSVITSTYHINDISIQNDNKMILVGGFPSVGNTVVNGIAKLNSDETVNTSFAMGVGFNFIVNKVKETSGGKILVCGSFTLYNNVPFKFFGRLNQDGTIDSSFNIGSGFNKIVYSFEIQPDGKIIVVGEFTEFNGVPANRIIRLNEDGTIDSSFIIGTGLNNYAKNVLIQPDGKIIVSGKFTTYNNHPSAIRVVRLNADGTFNSTFSGINYPPTAIALQQDGKLLVAYNDTSNNTSYIKRFNANGSFSAFNCIHSNSYINSYLGNEVGFIKIIPFADGKILVGGNFNTLSKNFMRLTSTGTVDATFNVGTGFNGIVNTIYIQPDNKLLVGGTFSAFNSSDVSPGLIKLNVDYSIDNSFNTGEGIGVVYDVSLQSDGKILVGGSMVNYATYTVGRLVRLLGSGFYNLSGQNKIDTNLNGCESSDFPFSNLKMNFNDGFSNYDFFVNNSGDYSFLLAQGSYTITPIVNPNFSILPTSISAIFPSQFTSLVQNYCITPLNSNYSDLDVQIIPLNTARPGFNAKYKIVYKNKGIITQSGNINLSFQDDVIDLVNSTPNFSNQSANSLSWDFTNLNPQEVRTIVVEFNLNSPVETPPLNIGSLLSFEANIINVLSDNTPNDNIFTLNQNVVNSYDPNDKTCLEGDVVGVDKIGDFVHYLIRFENNGTANAEFIRIEDFIDLSKYDISTLEPLNGSHSFITKISNGNKVEFYFNNINLPFDDANNDGYVMYKIKLKSTLQVGDSFSNTANIYFDFNSAIVTNTATSTIATLASEDFSRSTIFSIYPNPVKNLLSIYSKDDVNIKGVYIYNSLGQLVLTNSNFKNNEPVDVSMLSSGHYFMKLETDSNILNCKFIKE